MLSIIHSVMNVLGLIILCGYFYLHWLSKKQPVNVLHENSKPSSTILKPLRPVGHSVSLAQFLAIQH